MSGATFCYDDGKLLEALSQADPDTHETVWRFLHSEHAAKLRVQPSPPRTEAHPPAVEEQPDG